MNNKTHITAGLVVMAVAAMGYLAPAWAAGNVAAGKAKSAMCAGCHGPDGNDGLNPLWPKLAGQIPEYLVKQLKDFKSGARKDPIMSGMAAGLSDADIDNLAAYFSSRKTKPGAAANAAIAKAGEQLYRGGDAEAGIPACMACHGPAGDGVPPRFPSLSWQNAPYVEKQLLAFKADTRTNDGGLMTTIAFRMSVPQIKAVAQYIAGLH